MFMSSWFWDSRVNWHPDSASWSDPRALLGYIAEGFEGALGAAKKVINGATWRRTNAWKWPMDDNARTGHTAGASSTLFTGHQQFNTDWAAAALGPVMDGTDSSAAAAIRAASAAAAVTPPCTDPETDPDWTPGMRFGLDETETEIMFTGFGVGEGSYLGEADRTAAGCPMRLPLNASAMDCVSRSGYCEGKRYLRVGGGGVAGHCSDASVAVQADCVSGCSSPSRTTEVECLGYDEAAQRELRWTTRSWRAGAPPEAFHDADVPASVKEELDTIRFLPTRQNDGRFYGPPAASEQPCFDSPGPAPRDSQLYCTRTADATWIAWRWYRFVDQPEMNQVFLSIPESERDAAKCYMQQRIENLHAAQQGSGDSAGTRWFKPPQGADKLPAELVSIDSALLMTPPTGMEVGFVPIPVFQRKRAKPSDCDVTVGETTEEPNPLPSNYYEGYSRGTDEYDMEMCAGNSESGADFRYPGVVFQYPQGSADQNRAGYSVPLRSELPAALAGDTATCGLSSDPR